MENHKELVNDISNCLASFDNEGIILYPTDTIWGIGCDATQAAPIKKIFRLKKREEKKSMIILVSSIEMIGEYVTRPSQKLLDYVDNATKPTTAIFQHAYGLPQNLINEDGSIAIRVSNDVFCNFLVNELGKPIVSTSANISGDAYPKNFKEINSAIKNGVDYIVQHRQNDFSPSTPSNIIRLNDKDEIEFLR